MSTPADAATSVKVIRFDDVQWVSANIPDSHPSVRLGDLGTGPAGVRSVLVEFPPGWERPVTGHYEAAEEAMFLRGSLTIGERRFSSGAYVWFPPHYQRAPSASRDGALALARFEGPYWWSQGSAPDVTQPGSSTALRVLEQNFGVESTRGLQVLRRGQHDATWLATDASDVDVVGPVEVFSLTDLTWAYVPEGNVVPKLPGPLLCRGPDPGIAGAELETIPAAP